MSDLGADRTADGWTHLRPTLVEVLYGGYVGHDPGLPRLRPPNATIEPLQALGEAMLPYLQRPPCVVSFSGGRDSSLVLCVAARVAAQEGLPPPIPVTLRFRSAPQTNEDEWQELVVRHLGLADWTRLDFEYELEAVGPVAVSVLGQFGVLAPPNLHFHVPLFEVAAGGSLLTGVGGDEVFDSGVSRLGMVIARRDRLRVRDLRRLALVALPRSLRERALRVRRRVDHPWLRPAGRDLVGAAIAHEEAAMPERWDRALLAWWTSRYVQGSTRVFQAVARGQGVQAMHPFLDPRFLSAMSSRAGAGGFRDRTEVIHDLFTGVVPDSVAARRTKAVFDAPVWGPLSREFARSWDGQGVDHDLVDPEELRATWLATRTDYRSLLLMHTARLAAGV